MNMSATSQISLWIVAADVALILMHLLFFLVLLRHRQAVKQERGIFLYHAVFFVFACFGAALASAVLIGDVDFKTLVIVASLQGIYSMTFLESWSLSEGSFSYSILALLIQRRGQKLDVEASKSIGAQKRSVRSSSLVKLGLLNQEDNLLTASSRGRGVSRIFAFALWLINVKHNG